MSSNEVAKCYDVVAAEYADKYFRELESKPFDRMVLRRLAEQAAREGIICDLACGPGEVAVYLDSFGCQVVGVDLSEGMIKQAREQSPNIAFHCQDMMHLSFPDRYFSAIAAFYAIVHCSYDELDKAFSEWYRVIKPGGVLLFSFHLGSGIIHLEEFLGKKVSIDFAFFEPDDVMPRLRSSGFVVDDVLIRYPYDGVEYPSKRCYVFASR